MLRRGGTKKVLGGLIWASDWVPAGLSKRSATIGWRGAYKKIFGFTNPPYGRKRHFPIKNMFSPHFEILPAVPASWSTWQILGGLNIPLAPPLFSLGGLSPPKPPRFRRHWLCYVKTEIKVLLKSLANRCYNHTVTVCCCGLISSQLTVAIYGVKIQKLWGFYIITN